jgi:hypothetical protein
MQYEIHDSVLPRSLRTRGARVWVADSVVDSATLKAEGLHVVSILMWKDVYGEISIVFAVPTHVTVSLRQIAEFRQCALIWVSQWEKASGKPARHKSVRSAGQQLPVRVGLTKPDTGKTAGGQARC